FGLGQRVRRQHRPARLQSGRRWGAAPRSAVRLLRPRLSRGGLRPRPHLHWYRRILDAIDRIDMSDEVEGDAAGELARTVVLELARPLRELRETLALLMEGIDHHMAEAGGPVPLPWKALEALR